MRATSSIPPSVVRAHLTLAAIACWVLPGLAAAQGPGTSTPDPFAAVGSRSEAPTRALQETRPVTVEDVLAFRSLDDVAVSPDGSRVAYVVSERDFEENQVDTDVWVVDADGDEPVRLTRNPGSDSDPTWSPDGSWIAFRSDRGEEPQIYGIFPDGGEPWQVTDFETGVGDFRFAPDGDRIGFLASPPRSEADEELEERRGRPMVRDSAYADEWTHLWVAPLEERKAGRAEASTPDTLHVQGFVWAPNGRGLAFSARPAPLLRTYRHAETYVQGEPGGAVRKVSGLEGGEGPVEWDAALGLLVSGSGHLLGTHNTEIWRVPLGGGDPVSLTESLDENAGFVALAGGWLWIEASHRTGRRLYRIRIQDGRASGEPRTVSDDALYYSGFSASDDGRTFAFEAQGPGTPPDVHVTRADRFRPRWLTRINPRADRFALGEMRVVRWESAADGEEIEGVLTLPVGYEEGDRVPLLLRIHGGPSGVSTMSWTADDAAYPTQVFAGLGYAVLQPNYRGSTGYGERFRGLNRGHISGTDWVDVESGVDHLIEEGVADPDRLGVMGWSFGGHHTYWGITRTDRFKAASAGAGANELVSMYHATDLPEFYHTYLGPKPWEDFELYEERSAYRYVERVTTPLLIQVGEDDARVPRQQSDMFYEAMKAIGKAPVKMVVYPDQSHGVREPRLVRDLTTRNVEWFQRWIPTETDAAAEGGCP